MSSSKRAVHIATGAAVLAAVVYNSWPLGFALNPSISMHGGLASELEGLHQPYNWLFVVLDVICGALVLGMVGLLWRSHKLRWADKTILVSFGLFGVLTIIDALLPMPCEPSLTQCPSLSHQPQLVVHGIVSIAAGTFLLISALLTWYSHYRLGFARTMTFLLVAWTVFGLLSVYFFFVPGPGYLSQDYYLMLCGVWMILMPTMFAHTQRKRLRVAAA